MSGDFVQKALLLQQMETGGSDATAIDLWPLIARPSPERLGRGMPGLDGESIRVAGNERVSGKPASSELVLCEHTESIHRGVR